MSLNAKIIEQVDTFKNEKGEDMLRLLIDVPKEKPFDYMPLPLNIKVMHDYVSFKGSIGVEQQRLPDGLYPVQDTRGAINWMNIEGDIKINIRTMIDIVLPYLNKHPYLQQDCLEDRCPTSKELLRHKYLYGADIVRYKDETTHEHMVAFRRSGSEVVERVTAELFESIAPGAYLCKSKMDI